MNVVYVFVCHLPMINMHRWAIVGLTDQYAHHKIDQYVVANTVCYINISRQESSVISKIT